MTTTTVEIERTVTESEELTVCDECQREVDEAGKSFVGSEKVREHREEFAGGLVNGLPDGDLDLCSECIERLGGDVDPDYVQRSEDWLTSEDGTGGASIEQEASKAYGRTANRAKWGFVLGLGLLVATYLPMAPTIPVWVYALYGFGGLSQVAFAADRMLGVVKKIERKIDE